MYEKLSLFVSLITAAAVVVVSPRVVSTAAFFMLLFRTTAISLFDWCTTALVFYCFVKFKSFTTHSSTVSLRMATSTSAAAFIIIIPHFYFPPLFDSVSYATISYALSHFFATHYQYFY